MNNQKILFPTDFSKQSKDALSETVKFNQGLGCELIIVHAYSRPYSEGYDQQGQLAKTEQDIDKKFEKLLTEIPGLESQNHRHLKVLGDFIESTVDFVQKESVDLIIMSTKGASGIGELFGTKTAKIIKSVSIPVIVVPKASVLHPLEKIGLACDYSQETPKPKIEFLTQLAGAMNVQVDLITLNRDEKTMTKKELENRENLLSLFENLSVKLSFTQHKDLSRGLIEHARENEIGMIGVIPKSYNYIERIFHESLTEDMAFSSPIPVLVLN